MGASESRYRYSQTRQWPPTFSPYLRRGIMVQEPNSETELASSNRPQGDDHAMNWIATDVDQMSFLDASPMEIEERQRVPLGDDIVTREIRHSNIHPDEVQMSDSSEGGFSSVDNATTSGIGGEFSEEELPSMLQWLQSNVNYEVDINPKESHLQGGGPCRFTFSPELQPDVTSGRAKFGNAAAVELERLRNGFLLGTIPASPVPGWVPVKLESQDGVYLGQTKIKYHGDQMEMDEFFQAMMVNPGLLKRFFDKCNMHCTLVGNPETTGGEAQYSGPLGPTHPVRMLRLLVYAAAENGGAKQFLEMIFTSSAGRIVFDAYKDSSTLPEVIAKDHGNEEIANYLKGVTKRFSEEIRTGKECSQTIDWSELAKAAEVAQKELDLKSAEEKFKTKRDIFKETGYLGDVDTSSSESSNPQSSDSDDDKSATLRKGSVSQEGKFQLKKDRLEYRNGDAKVDRTKLDKEDSGSRNRYSKTQQRPLKSSGFLGRGRTTRYYSSDVKIYVHEITAPVLGRELVRRCGNEGQHRYLDATGYTTLRFLRAAISFIPDAIKDGGDMRNAAFILSQPGREFLILAGNGDWEFYFAEEEDGQIHGRCVRKPFVRYMWDGVKSIVCPIVSRTEGLFSTAGPASRLALTA